MFKGIEWIEQLPPWNGVNFTPLNVSHEILNRLDNPQDSFKSLHIAGTNGKGTVSSLLSYLLTKSGLYKKVGLMTSPHLFKMNERCRINNQIISDEVLDSSLLEVKNACEGLKVSPTYFTAITCAIFNVFKQEKVEIGVIEVGLGGRNDATNVMSSSLCSVITTIGFDHQEQLGNSLGEIALNKAGIIKNKSSVVVGDLKSEAMAQISSVAASCSSIIHSYGKEFYFDQGRYVSKNRDIFIYDPLRAFLPKYLCHNLSIALYVLELLSYKIENLIPELNDYSWDRRFELRINKLLSSHVIIDGAHNIEGVSALLSDISDYIKLNKHIDKITFVVSFLKRKNWRECFSEIVDYIKSLKGIEVQIYGACFSDDFVSHSDYLTISDLHLINQPRELENIYSRKTLNALYVHIGSLRHPELLDSILDDLEFEKKPIWKNLA